jgi:hypothetical protein
MYCRALTSNRRVLTGLASLAILAVLLMTPVGMDPAGAQESTAIIPREGASLNYIHVPFRWDSDRSATGYQLQIAEDSGASTFATGSSVVDSTTTSTEPGVIVTSGLKFGQSYAWRVRGITPAGPSAWSPVRRFSTQPLPYDPKIVVTRGPSTHPPEPGLTLLVQGTAWAVDTSGAIVWFLPESGGDIQLLPNGNFSYFGGGRAYERTLDGRTVWMSPDDPSLFMHHELSTMPNGNYLTLVREFRDVVREGKTEKWLGDAIVEIKPCTNEIVWRWSAFDYFSTKDFDDEAMLKPLPDGSGYDWTHGNAAVYDPRTNSVYASWRHLSRITRIDYATRRVIYNMGMNLPSGDTKFGDDFFSFQHAPQLLPNGNMVLFDNGNRRKNPATPRMTKALEVAFSGGASPTSADIVWEYVLPEFISFAGDANRLPGGNTLVTASEARKIYEVDPAGKLVWTLALTGEIPKNAGRAIYRSERIPSLFRGPIGGTPDRCAQR